jgi:hypothetical protein
MINPNGKSSCPAGWTRSTHYCTKKVEEEKPAKGAPAKTSSAAPAGGGTTAQDPDRTSYGKPVLKRVAKRDELDYCPSGYFTSHVRRGECISDQAAAPDVSPKQGSCPAGTTEEQGLYCTGSTAMTVEQLHQAFVSDFNIQYFKRKNLGLDTARENHRPTLYAQASDAAAAAKAAPSAAATPADGTTAQAPGGTVAAAPAAASAPQDAKAAAKALGAAMKGLFSR